MYKATRTYLTDDGAPWDAIVANENAVTALGTRIAAIDTKVTAQEAELSGLTLNKDQKRNTLETATLLVAGGVEAYARATENLILLADVELEATDLTDASDQTVDDFAERVRAAADANLAALADYGITAAEMTALTDAITAFETAKSLPDARRALRKAHTQTLEPMFRETSEFLDGQLDVLMRRYKTENPTFHAGYEAARVIIDLRGPGEEDDEDPDPVP